MRSRLLLADLAGCATTLVAGQRRHGVVSRGRPCTPSPDLHEASAARERRALARLLGQLRGGRGTDRDWPSVALKRGHAHWHLPRRASRRTAAPLWSERARELPGEGDAQVGFTWDSVPSGMEKANRRAGTYSSRRRLPTMRANPVARRTEGSLEARLRRHPHCRRRLELPARSRSRRVVVARAGLVAVQALESGEGSDQTAATVAQPVLVILDVRPARRQRPYEVCRQLREGFGEVLPIIFISGERTDPIDHAAGMLVGGDDYLVKPFDPDELLASVRRLIERSHVPQDGHSAAEGRSELTKRELETLESARCRQAVEWRSRLRLVISEKDRLEPSAARARGS